MKMPSIPWRDIDWQHLATAAARAAPPDTARACQSDLSLMLGLALLEIPQDGIIVKTGATCPVLLVIVAMRPDIRIISIGDGDKLIDHEQQTINEILFSKKKASRERRRLKEEAGTQSFEPDVLVNYEHRVADPGKDIYFGDALEEAEKYSSGPVSLFFLDSDFTVEGLTQRLKAWIPHLTHPGWVVLHDWGRTGKSTKTHQRGSEEMYENVREAAQAVFNRLPDKESDWSGAWKIEGGQP